jgi:hypothetical protein
MGFLSKEYTTHMPMLIKCVQATDGPVMECGSGLASTPLLHWLCHDKARQLWSFEEKEEYYKYARKFQSKYHRIRLVDFKKFNVKGHWSVALVDQSTRMRTPTILYLKDKVDYIVIHDTQAESVYHYADMWKEFKYVHHWKGCTPWTSVVSNFKNLKWLENSVL